MRCSCKHPGSRGTFQGGGQCASCRTRLDLLADSPFWLSMRGWTFGHGCAFALLPRQRRQAPTVEARCSLCVVNNGLYAE